MSVQHFSPENLEALPGSVGDWRISWITVVVDETHFSRVMDLVYQALLHPRCRIETIAFYRTPGERDPSLSPALKRLIVEGLALCKTLRSVHIRTTDIPGTDTYVTLPAEVLRACFEGLTKNETVINLVIGLGHDIDTFPTTSLQRLLENTVGLSRLCLSGTLAEPEALFRGLHVNTTLNELRLESRGVVDYVPLPGSMRNLENVAITSFGGDDFVEGLMSALIGSDLRSLELLCVGDYELTVGTAVKLRTLLTTTSLRTLDLNVGCHNLSAAQELAAGIACSTSLVNLSLWGERTRITLLELLSGVERNGRCRVDLSVTQDCPNLECLEAWADHLAKTKLHTMKVFSSLPSAALELIASALQNPDCQLQNLEFVQATSSCKLETLDALLAALESNTSLRMLTVHSSGFYNLWALVPDFDARLAKISKLRSLVLRKTGKRQNDWLRPGLLDAILANKSLFNLVIGRDSFGDIPRQGGYESTRHVDETTSQLIEFALWRNRTIAFVEETSSRSPSSFAFTFVPSALASASIIARSPSEIVAASAVFEVLLHYAADIFKTSVDLRKEGAPEVLDNLH